MSLENPTTAPAPVADQNPAPAATEPAPAAPLKTEPAPDADAIDWADPTAIAAALEKEEAGQKDEAKDGTAEGDKAAEGQEGDEKDAKKAEEVETSAEGDAAASTPPPFWNEEARAAWDKLPPEIRAEVRRVEGERENVLTSAIQQTKRATDIHNALYQYAQSELTQAIQAAQAAVQGEFGGLDAEKWAAIQKENPEMALQLEGLYTRRMAGIQAIVDQQNQLTQAGEAYRLQEQGRYLMAQAEDAKARLKNVLGAEFVPDTFKNEATEYLTKMGVSPEHIAGLTHGYQVELIAKAMKYDKMMGTAKAAADKLAAAPKVMPPTKAGPAGASASDPKDAAHDALALLNKDPYSNENIAAALAKL